MLSIVLPAAMLNSWLLNMDFLAPQPIIRWSHVAPFDGPVLGSDAAAHLFSCLVVLYLREEASVSQVGHGSPTPITAV